jgi:hypothetical protein
MTLTNEQYERIARHLDGEDVRLTAEERAAADEIRGDERRLGSRLDVSIPPGAAAHLARPALLAEIHRDEAAIGRLLDADVPPETLARVHRRVVAALASPRRRLMRIGGVAAALAAAAVVLLAVTLATTWVVPPPPEGVADAVKSIPVEVIAESVRAPMDADVDLLAREIDQLEYEVLAATPPAVMDVGIDQIQQALEEFWLMTCRSSRAGRRTGSARDKVARCGEPGP